MTAPLLALESWRDTCTTLHMWTQIVGKTRLALAPPENHWWHIALYVTPRGLTTSAMSHGTRTFAADFDFLDHQLYLRTSDGATRAVPLAPRAVADFYTEYLEALRSLDSTSGSDRCRSKSRSPFPLPMTVSTPPTTPRR